jgi:hypothetical protein
MTTEEARLMLVEGINYAAYKETDSSLYDSDKNRLLGCEHFRSGREVRTPSPWSEGDFEGNMATLLRWADSLNESNPEFAEAQRLLEGEDSVLGRVIQRSREDDSALNPPERQVPRWVQVLMGLIVGTFTLLCAFASLPLLMTPPEAAPILGVVVGFFLILGCLWVLEKCVRLITGRKNKGGLMSPTALRVIAICMLLLPIAGFFTGYSRKMGFVAVFQAVMYFFGFLGLLKLARKRETENA